VRNTLTWFVGDEGIHFQTDVNNNTPTAIGAAAPIVSTEVSDIFFAPRVEIDNYTTVNIVKPWESAFDVTDSGSVEHHQNYVVLGGVSGFFDNPVVTVGTPTVNFFDNHADNGGSPPGGPDNLVLGVTNFNNTLTPLDIGFATVQINVALIDPTTINDFEQGTFEIGATNVTNLNAQSTSHLIMDLPGTNWGTGIVVNGSLTGQNLIQGTSGQVFIDQNGNHGVVFPDGTGFQPGGSGEVTIPVTFGGVGNTYEAFQDSPGHWELGNDTLTGGVGGKGVLFTEIGGLWGVTHPTNVYQGNSGDNYFPEGGNDTVNLAHASGGAFSTVWFAMYDVCNSGGPDFATRFTDSGVPGIGPKGLLANGGTGIDWGVGSNFENGQTLSGVYGQAVTDIFNGQEAYVDNYATSLLKVNGFVAGSEVPGKPHTGDILNFDVNDWATGALSNGGNDLGLVNSQSQSLAALGWHNVDGLTQLVGGTAGEEVEPNTTVVIDTNGPFANTAQLVTSLTGNGSIQFVNETLGAHGIEHILIAYQGSDGAHIADLKLTNTTGGALGGGGGLTTNTAGLTVQATDLIDLVGVQVEQLHNSNFHFV